MYTEFSGTFGDGTPYAMRVPTDWNGVLLRDLDYVSRADSRNYLYLLEQGFAFSGIGRHSNRWLGGYDPIREIERIDLAHDAFVERFGNPRRVIQMGCSGGGRVGTLISELDAPRVDGVLAAGDMPMLSIGNTVLDFWFTMKVLLAPELEIESAPVGGFTPRILAWRRVISEAQRTPEGRARLALAVTIGQVPAWADGANTPNPDPNDVTELQRSMYETLMSMAIERAGGGAAIQMLELAPGFGVNRYQASWNDDVDYRQFFENGNEHYKRAVLQLYEEAGLDLEADLERINDAPRITADSRAIDYWSAPGRHNVGRPTIPVLRWQDIGDLNLSVANVQGYQELVRANGREEWIRYIFTAVPTHCSFTTAELATALEVLMHRLDTGSWGRTDPEYLSELGNAIDDGVTRFVAFDDRYMVRKYNRTWVPRN